MTARLDPERALVHLRELSPDIREGVVLDADGNRVAGSVALAGPAAELVTRTTAAEVEVVTDRGAVFAVRSARAAIAVVTARAALASITLFDLRVVLSRLDLPGGAA
jgi:hypothetical protein